MQVSVQKLPKSAIKLTVTVPVDQVKASQEKVLADIVKDAELDGFRKGKAPAELVKQKIDPQKFDGEVMSHLVKTYYPQAVEEQKLLPIISPKIEIEAYDAEKDFTFTAETAVRPPIKVGDYRQAIKKSYDKKVDTALQTRIDKSRQSDGVEQPKDQSDKAKDTQTTSSKDGNQEGQSDDNQNKVEKNPTDNRETHVHMSPTDIVDAILTVTQVEIPDMVLEEEVNRMLSRLVQQLQPLNLGMDAYLKSINKTGDQLRAEYAQVAQKNVASEMALVDVVAKEKVEVDDKEVEATADAMGDAKLKERYMQNPLEKAYIKAIIAKNKLIWKLISEVEGEDEHVGGDKTKAGSKKADKGGEDINDEVKKEESDDKNSV